MHIIAGKFKGRRLTPVKSKEVRPTLSQLREAVFNICRNEIEGARVLDLFAGSGAMGLEALSRGAKHATFVEKDKSAVACIRKNIELLDVKANTTILMMDMLQALKKLSRQNLVYDLIYADPPYGKGWGEKIVEAIDSSPLLERQGMLFIEDVDFKEPELHQLKLKSTRKAGRANLYDFRFIGLS